MLKRRPFFLLEILISLALLSLLLTFLFSFLASQMQIEKRTELLRRETFRRQLIQTRCQDLFTTIDKDEEFCSLYTDPEHSLTIVFNNGIDPDPAFCGPVLGKLYLDDEKNLCFTLWPLDVKKKNSWRTEILLPQIKKINWSFMKETMPVEWVSEWPSGKHEIPSFIRLEVIRNEGSLFFAFHLPTSLPIITYKERVS